MLINGAHLLPDLSGALIWPKERLVAFADPLPPPGDRLTGQVAADVIRRMAAVLRQHRPARALWLGRALPLAIAAAALSPRDGKEIERMAAACALHWIGPDLPDAIPGTCQEMLEAGALTFRLNASAGAPMGEIAAAPRPQATASVRGERLTLPCYVMDGRRMLLPAFGPRLGGTDVMTPPILSLYRRPFQVLMVGGGRLTALPRARLEPEGASRPARTP